MYVEATLEIIRRIVAGVLLDAFMGVVLLLSLIHHFTTTFFETEPDYRDTRSSSSKIEQQSHHIIHDNMRASRNHKKCYEDIKLTNKKNTIEHLEYRLVPSLNYYFGLHDIEIEEYKIKTEDNYTLDVWHLKNPANETIKRKPMLMIHGLLQSSGGFASGSQNSLAYYFYSLGYDIWLGNNRIGFTTESNDDEYWDWDINEMAEYDLITMVEFVKSKTQFKKISLVGHSQGTTQIFLALINNYNDIINDIENFVALAPATYPGPLLFDSIVINLLSKGVENKYIFGNKCFLRIMMIVRNICVGRAFFSFICYVIFNYFFDWNDTLWGGPNLRNRHFLFSPVYVSVKLMKWWLGSDTSKASFKNKPDEIFPETSAWFDKFNPDNKDSNPNILLFVPKQDRLVDGERLINHFVKHENNVNYKIWYINEYSHLDVLWATDVIDRIGKPIAENLKFHDPELLPIQEEQIIPA
ncbi:hypothetical protein C6P45_005490 [Maudiozyma exigua]|uniref:Partial AB-hydrolase lipase domain-containing protein n=1 Tax=Maudiozyma exigua TaxID=34358 RepID=A0A9P6WAL7_MAUEX|nr:hypothetical protein C6P45_005490 [Kazachstania exigua]